MKMFTVRIRNQRLLLLYHKCFHALFLHCLETENLVSDLII